MLNENHTVKNSIFFLLLIVAGLAVAAAEFTKIDLTGLATDEVGTLFLTALFTALVIERAVEVWINYRFDPKKRDILKSVLLAEQAISAYQKHIDDLNSMRKAGDPPMPELSVATLGLKNARKAKFDEEQAVSERLRQHLNDKTRSAQYLALILSLAAAACGVRILAQFAPADLDGAIKDPAQLFLFRSTDVVLTTLLLAGGADGIHKIIGPFLKMKDDITK